MIFDMNRQVYSPVLAYLFLFSRFQVRFTLLASGSEPPHFEGHYWERFNLDMMQPLLGYLKLKVEVKSEHQQFQPVS